MNEAAARAAPWPFLGLRKLANQHDDQNNNEDCAEADPAKAIMPVAATAPAAEACPQAAAEQNNDQYDEKYETHGICAFTKPDWLTLRLAMRRALQRPGCPSFRRHLSMNAPCGV